MGFEFFGQAGRLHHKSGSRLKMRNFKTAASGW
jgi:hypothetical protein